MLWTRKSNYLIIIISTALILLLSATSVTGDLKLNQHNSLNESTAPSNLNRSKTFEKHTTSKSISRDNNSSLHTNALDPFVNATFNSTHQETLSTKNDLIPPVPHSELKEEGRVVGSLLGGNSGSCLYRGSRYQCTVSLACWLSGGRLESGCGNGHLLTEWLFSCCIPPSAHSRLPAVPPLRRADRPHFHHQLPHHHYLNHIQQIHHQQKVPPQQAQLFGNHRNAGGNGVQFPTPQLASAPAAAGHFASPNKHLHHHHNHRSKKHRHFECGVPVLQLQKRIIGGDEAYFGELPWQAHLRIAGYQCGGVLVSKHFVATAAHCIHRAALKDILIYLGEYDTQNTGQYTEPYPEQVHRAVQKIVHPNFQYRLSQPDRFDVALIRLAKGVVFRENILPICLPKKNISFKGKTAVVAGWGKTDTSYGKTGTNILQKAVVPILSDEECLEWHKHKNIQVELHKEMFCAGHSDGRIDACLGDSGGPLIVKESGRWTLAGITSAGFGCAVDHQPGIYHKIQLTRDWIVSQINGNNA